MKVLVVRFSSIGDIVLTSSVIRAMKQQVPNIKIHYLTKDKFESLVVSNPAIEKVHTIAGSVNERIDDLKNENFDYVVDLHNNLRTGSLKKKLKKPSTTVKKLNIEKFLLVKFKVNRMPKKHVVDRYFDTVKVLGVINDEKKGDYFIPEIDHVAPVTELGFVSKEYICLAVGAQFKTKQMPVDLLVKITNGSKYPVVIVGGVMDRNVALDVLSKTTNKHVVNACGDFNLNQSASIVSQGLKLVTNDTGMMHIAACFNVQVISVWGNTTPDLGMYPYYPNNSALYSIHEVKNLGCRPCSKIGFQECPKKHFQCMELQNADEIILELNK